jgi:hypothetical protein
MQEGNKWKVSYARVLSTATRLNTRSFSFQPEVPSRRIIFAYMIKGWSGAKEERKEKANKKKSKKEN